MESEQMTLMSLPLVSRNRAKMLALQGRKPGLERERAQDCGQKLTGLLASYDRKSSSWKTSQICFLAQANNQADGLAAYLGTWPSAGMMLNGNVYPLPALARRMKGTVSGLLPTPTKHNSKEGAYPAEFTRNTPTLATHAGGKINPEWSEHLMGFPIGWTELEPLETP